MSKRQKQKQEDFASLEEFIQAAEMRSDCPSREWLHNNFKSKSAMVRYLYLEKKQDLRNIQSLTGLGYRHVYSIIRKLKTAKLPEHVCPVCLNRKG